MAFPPWPAFLGGALVSMLRWGSIDRGGPSVGPAPSAIAPDPSRPPRLTPLCPKCERPASFVDAVHELCVCNECREPFSFAWAKRAARERELQVIKRLRGYLIERLSQRARWAMRQQRARDRRKRLAKSQGKSQEDVHGSRVA